MAMCLMQVEDQLCEIFDRVDVVMRRGRNERYSWLASPQVRNVRADLLARKLATLACTVDMSRSNVLD